MGGELRVYDATGRLVLEGRGTSFSTRGLDPGVYFLETRSAGPGRFIVVE